MQNSVRLKKCLRRGEMAVEIQEQMLLDQLLERSASLLAAQDRLLKDLINFEADCAQRFGELQDKIAIRRIENAQLLRKFEGKKTKAESNRMRDGKMWLNIQRSATLI